jgi:hypothetical protein
MMSVRANFSDDQLFASVRQQLHPHAVLSEIVEQLDFRSYSLADLKLRRLLFSWTRITVAVDLAALPWQQDRRMTLRL